VPLKHESNNARTCHGFVWHLSRICKIPSPGQVRTKHELGE
jgi:hypothetical protein